MHRLWKTYLHFAALNQELSHGLYKSFKEIPGVLQEKQQLHNRTEQIDVNYNYTPCNPSKKGEKKQKYVTLSSLLLVRKSVEGFRIAVIALASSSCTVRVVEDVYGSVLNTYCSRHGKKCETNKK